MSHSPPPPPLPPPLTLPLPRPNDLYRRSDLSNLWAPLLRVRLPQHEPLMPHALPDAHHLREDVHGGRVCVWGWGRERGGELFGLFDWRRGSEQWTDDKDGVQWSVGFDSGSSS
jgi:hypothetical protein